MAIFTSLSSIYFLARYYLFIRHIKHCRPYQYLNMYLWSLS
ncbi:hypothetical protein HMPREF0880_02936 [Yokenella regensburgei ATCC 43003]|nr:hypothetical protein HMPREF0880_02936 [Yokenella regensburgei ATCC 43003]